MPAKDTFHDSVRNALVKDGWTITDDPYTVAIGEKNAFIDLGAERILAAEKGTDQIAVEIKSFQGPSDLNEFQNALGQYIFYRSLLSEVDPARELYIAIPFVVLETTFQEPIAKPALDAVSLRVIAFDPKHEKITQWLP